MRREQPRLRAAHEIRDLQQKLEAYLAGYRMADGAVVKDTVLDQHAMDVLDTINWPENNPAYEQRMIRDLQQKLAPPTTAKHT